MGSLSLVYNLSEPLISDTNEDSRFMTDVWDLAGINLPELE